jgi:hypothetical protein
MPVGNQNNNADYHLALQSLAADCALCHQINQTRSLILGDLER